MGKDESKSANKTYFVLIVSIVILAAVAVFAAINHEEVRVNLLWIAEPETSVALLVLVSLALGMVFMASVDLVRRFRMGRQIAKLKAQLKDLEAERDNLRIRLGEPVADTAKKDKSEDEEK